jgi:hypothetical protein
MRLFHERRGTRGFAGKGVHNRVAREQGAV